MTADPQITPSLIKLVFEYEYNRTKIGTVDTGQIPRVGDEINLIHQEVRYQGRVTNISWFIDTDKNQVNVVVVKLAPLGAD